MIDRTEVGTSKSPLYMTKIIHKKPNNAYNSRHPMF